MPVYTAAFPVATLPNDIKENFLNPFVEPVLQSGSVVHEDGIERPLDVPTKLPEGENENYKRQYYKNLFSAPTTAGYNQMTQVTFVRKTGAITGYQIGTPKI